MLRDKWKDLVDGVNDVRADDINIIAHQAMENEELKESKDNKMATWHDDKVSPETYPSSLAMIEGVQKIHSNMLDVELAEGGKINKAIKESGGGGSTQSDYNQNDSTQPDYIKNRPFYDEKISIDIDNPSDFRVDDFSDDYEGSVDADITSKLFDFSGEHTPIVIEVVENGTTHKREGYLYREGAFLDSEFNEGLGVQWDEGDILFIGLDPEGGILVFRNEYGGSLEGVSIKIYREIAKQIDKKYLPPNDVPYIYSEDGSVRLHDLDTGVYVLHGIFELGGQNEGCWFEDSFSYRPTLCQLINDKDEMFIRLSWVDSNIDDGLVGRYVEVYGSEVNVSEYFSLMDLFSVADEALSVAYDAAGMAEDASGAVADAYAMAEDALSASDMGVAAHCTITEFINGDLPLPAIALCDENGDKWWLMIDSSGKVNAMKD